MVTVIIQALGLTLFVASTAILGARLRRGATPEGAESSSRLAHLFFYAGIFAPAMLGVFYPGLTDFDELVGLPTLPQRPLAFIIGALALGPGLYITSASSKALMYHGKGYRAFRLTKKLVRGGMYSRVRNPMALGFYLTIVGIGLMVGSTYVTLVSLFAVLPAHIFYLRYFEEAELNLRFGPEYLLYKQSVPFLIPARFGSKGA